MIYRVSGTIIMEVEADSEENALIYANDHDICCTDDVGENTEAEVNFTAAEEDDGEEFDDSDADEED